MYDDSAGAMYEQEEYARHERDERRAPAAAEEVREQPRQAERRDAEAV